MRFLYIVEKLRAFRLIYIFETPFWAIIISDIWHHVIN